jgi:hypothetical protein
MSTEFLSMNVDLVGLGRVSSGPSLVEGEESACIPEPSLLR